MHDNIEQDLSDIFSDSPLETEIKVELPSRGKFYTNKISTITLRPLVFEDEKSIAIASRGKKVSGLVNTMLARCIKDQPIEFVEQMVIIDKVYLIVKLREISYGKDYHAVITCARCDEQTNAKVDISTFEVNFVDDLDTEPIEVKLPSINKTAKVSVARVKDEVIFDNSENLINSLWKYVRELAGKTNPIVISKAIQKLPIRDAGKLIEACVLTGYGVNSSMSFVCPGCSDESVVEVPITSDFFSAKSPEQET